VGGSVVLCLSWLQSDRVGFNVLVNTLRVTPEPSLSSQSLKYAGIDDNQAEQPTDKTRENINEHSQTGLGKKKTDSKET